MLFALIEVSKKGKAPVGGLQCEERPKGGMGAPLNRGKAPVGGSGWEERPKGRGEENEPGKFTADQTYVIIG